MMSSDGSLPCNSAVGSSADVQLVQVDSGDHSRSPKPISPTESTATNSPMPQPLSAPHGSATFPPSGLYPQAASFNGNPDLTINGGDFGNRIENLHQHYYPPSFSMATTPSQEYGRTPLEAISPIPPEEQYRAEHEKLLEHVASHCIHDAIEHTGIPISQSKAGHIKSTLLSKIIQWPTHLQHKKVLWLPSESPSHARTLSKLLAEECEANGRLGGSFLLPMTVEDNRGLINDRLVATLAHQLAYHPNLPMDIRVRSRLLSAIRANPLIFSKTLGVQLKKLIMDPLQALQNLDDSQTATCPDIVVIDFNTMPDSATSEGSAQSTSREGDIQAAALRTIVKILRDSAFLPFRLVVFTGPQDGIAKVFRKRNTAEIVSEGVLDRFIEQLDDCEGDSSSCTPSEYTLRTETYTTAPDFFEEEEEEERALAIEGVLPNRSSNADVVNTRQDVFRAHLHQLLAIGVRPIISNFISDHTISNNFGASTSLGAIYVTEAHYVDETLPEDEEEAHSTGVKIDIRTDHLHFDEDDPAALELLNVQYVSKKLRRFICNGAYNGAATISVNIRRVIFLRRAAHTFELEQRNNISMIGMHQKDSIQIVGDTPVKHLDMSIDHLTVWTFAIDDAHPSTPTVISLDTFDSSIPLKINLTIQLLTFYEGRL